MLSSLLLLVSLSRSLSPWLRFSAAAAVAAAVVVVAVC